MGFKKNAGWLLGLPFGVTAYVAKELGKESIRQITGVKPSKKKKQKPTKVYDHKGKLICIQYPDGKKDWFNRRY